MSGDTTKELGTFTGSRAKEHLPWASPLPLTLHQAKLGPGAQAPVEISAEWTLCIGGWVAMGGKSRRIPPHPRRLARAQHAYGASRLPGAFLHEPTGIFHLIYSKSIKMLFSKGTAAEMPGPGWDLAGGRWKDGWLWPRPGAGNPASVLALGTLQPVPKGSTGGHHCLCPPQAGQAAARTRLPDGSCPVLGSRRCRDAFVGKLRLPLPTAPAGLCQRPTMAPCAGRKQALPKAGVPLPPTIPSPNVLATEHPGPVRLSWATGLFRGLSAPPREVSDAVGYKRAGSSPAPARSHAGKSPMEPTQTEPAASPHGRR